MVVGLGSGTTAAIFIDLLGKRVRDGLDIRATVTSNESERLARVAGIPLLDMSEAPSVDVDIDGADEIDSDLNLLKGGGGALLHEKLIALSSNQVIIIADESKMVPRLGKRPVPVEIVPFYWVATASRVKGMGGTCELRLNPTGQPFVTDSANFILDVCMPETVDVADFAAQLKSTSGVVEHGLFLGLASVVIIGRTDGEIDLLSPSPQPK
jgi:ribose 5-phosphate isomerase A